MAEYITANRWITGVATHKTKRGPILCTGLGCVGCFPQDFPEIACELEVYDSKTGLLFAESWTNDLSNKSAVETRGQRNKHTKRKKHIRRKSSRNSEGEKFSEKEAVNSDRSDVSERKESGEEVKKFFLTECETEENKKGIEKITIASTSDCSFEETNFPFATERCTSYDRFRVVDREDCVCLFFALEYNHNSPRLTDLSILEIIGSLTTIMSVNEIKYVQRLKGLWHIVLRTRKHLRYMLTSGLKIRGSWYRVIQDNDKYCEKVN